MRVEQPIQLQKSQRKVRVNAGMPKIRIKLTSDYY